MIALPETPERLLAALVAIFPEFQREWEPGEEPETLHSVMPRFTPFFGTKAPTITKREACRLGELINIGVQHEGLLENAIATCFLEHLGQIHAWKVLKPHLSERARRKAHA